MRRALLAVLLLLPALTWAKDTPLMFAAAVDNPEVVQALLDAGADATAKNGEGETAWDLIQYNNALKSTNVYHRLNELQLE